MARKIRFDYPGAVHHVYARGNERQPIFRCDDDRRIFLNLLSKAVERFEWSLQSYTLMDNHYHFALKTIKATLSEGMQWFNSVYSKKFNSLYERVGHLFQGRFQNTLVQSGPHLAVVNRYVVLNPVRAKMVAYPADYQWTSYAATIGQAPVPKFLDVDAVLADFGGVKNYADYVTAGISQKPDKIYQPIYGDKAFIKEKIVGLDDVKFIKLVRPSLEELIPFTTKRNPEILNERNHAIREAATIFRYCHAEIAEYLKMTRSSITKILKR